VGLSGQVADIVRPHLLDDPNQVGGIREIAQRWMKRRSRSCGSSESCFTRPVLNEDERRFVPWTTRPLSSCRSAKQPPSWPPDNDERWLQQRLQ
jgi:hypothetical protein